MDDDHDVLYVFSVNDDHDWISGTLVTVHSTINQSTKQLTNRTRISNCVKRRKFRNQNLNNRRARGTGDRIQGAILKPTQFTSSTRPVNDAAREHRPSHCS